MSRWGARTVRAARNGVPTALVSEKSRSSTLSMWRRVQWLGRNQNGSLGRSAGVCKRIKRVWESHFKHAPPQQDWVMLLMCEVAHAAAVVQSRAAADCRRSSATRARQTSAKWPVRAPLLCVWAASASAVCVAGVTVWLRNRQAASRRRRWRQRHDVDNTVNGLKVGCRVRGAYTDIH